MIFCGVLKTGLLKCNEKKKSFKYLFLIAFSLFLNVPPSFAQNVNDIRFPAENWSADLLQIIEAGPQYLPNDMDVHVEPPPANDSIQTKYELSRLRGYKNLRTEDVRSRILFENDPELSYPGFLPILLTGIRVITG